MVWENAETFRIGLRDNMNTKSMLIAYFGIAFFVAAWGNVPEIAKSCSALKTPLPKHDDRIIPPVAIVYSEKYLIDLGGLERFHPFDIHKYKKIVAKLKRVGALEDKYLFASRRDHRQRYLENSIASVS